MQSDSLTTHGPRAERSNCLRRCAAALLAMAAGAAICASSASATEYTPGRGLSLLGDDLVLGGYLKLELEVLDDTQDAFVFDDISAFLTYRFGPNLRLFTEAELEDSLVFDDDGVGTGHDVFKLERLYLEYEPTTQLRLRAGKLLTPIGIWNPIHAAPLVWTSTRPVASEAIFDTGITGLQLDVSLRVAELDALITGFGQATGQLDDTDDRQDIHRGGGARVQLGSLGRWHTGLSYLRFNDNADDRWETVFASDFLFENDDWEVSSELAVNDPSGMGKTTWAIYFQVVRHLTAKFHPFLRYEHARLAEGSGNPLVVGIAYKPTPTTILKAEAVLSTEDLAVESNGFVMSFAALF